MSITTSRAVGVLNLIRCRLFPGKSKSSRLNNAKYMPKLTKVSLHILKSIININDYYKNEWDKGHMAPAGSFTDSWSNLAKTFSFFLSKRESGEVFDFTL